MQYFFKKNSPKKANNLKKYIVYRVFSKKAINAESIKKSLKLLMQDHIVMYLRKICIIALSFIDQDLTHLGLAKLKIF
jgi:hypothetical protein